VCGGRQQIRGGNATRHPPEEINELTFGLMLTVLKGKGGDPEGPRPPFNYASTSR